jgi:hypothetical protein
MNADAERKAGDVFQINESYDRKGWIGAFVMATEVKSWGIQGFVHVIESHDQAQRAYTRLEWSDIEFVGAAPLVLEDE